MLFLVHIGTILDAKKLLKNVKFVFMKNALTISILLLSTLLTAQETEETAQDSIPEGWNNKGKVSFLFNQAAFSNWTAGGENSISGTLGVNYHLNYNRDNWAWDTNIIVAYGLTQTKNSEFTKKTDDRFELNTIVGKKGSEAWYYSGFLNFKTQITKGYRYNTDDNGKEIRSEYTNFFSPAYLSFGPGVLWKKNDNCKFNIAPGTSKVTLVNEEFTLPSEEYFGVPEGKNSRYELGFYASGYYKFDIMKNMTLENIINLYANYLQQPENVDIDYNVNLVMVINEYFSTTLNFQTIYDDNAFEGFQTREVLGLGINYDF